MTSVDDYAHNMAVEEQLRRVERRIDRLCFAWWSAPKGSMGDARRKAVEPALKRLTAREDALYAELRIRS